MNSVSALILDRKVTNADEMVTKLARFLRLGLAADPTEKIALSSEIELQRIYLEIEQLRYEDLVIDVSVPDELEPALVPALILQPIVENAVKYGVAGAPPPAHIAVRAWAEDRRLLIEVTDPKHLMSIMSPTSQSASRLSFANSFSVRQIRSPYG